MDGIWPRSGRCEDSLHLGTQLRSAVVSLLLCLLALTGCAQSSPASESEVLVTKSDLKAVAIHLEEEGYRHQAEVFSDGVITSDEYWSSIQLLRECVESGGFGFSEPQLSPVTGITYEFVFKTNGRDGPDTAKWFEDCEAQFWVPVSTYFNSTHRQKMDLSLKTALLECLDRKGTPGVQTGRNLAEIAPVFEGAEETRINARDCLYSEGEKLFPDLVSMTVFD